MLAADAAFQSKIYGSGTAALIISNKEMEDIIKAVKSLNKNKSKEQKKGFLSMLLGKLAATILGNTLAGRGVIQAGEGLIRAGENF